MRLRKSFLLILTVSALLLSAAKNAKAQSPNPKQHEGATETKKSGTEPESHGSPQACPSVTVIIKEIPAPIAKEITAVVNQAPYKHWWNGPNGPQWAMFLLTILVVLVSSGLFVVTRLSAQASKNAADFSKRVFYTTYRPWVLVSDFEIRTMENGGYVVEWKAYNPGPLPAIYRGGNTSVHVRPTLPDDPEFAAARVEADMLPPASTAEKGFKVLSARLHLSKKQWNEIASGRVCLFFLGYMRYQGPFKTPEGKEIDYQTGFAARFSGMLYQEWLCDDELTSPMIAETDPRYNYIR